MLNTELVDTLYAGLPKERQQELITLTTSGPTVRSPLTTSTEATTMSGTSRLAETSLPRTMR